MSTTLVTCWFDLECRGGEKGRRDFSSLGSAVLSLPLPMVVFCDPWVADQVKIMRGSAFLTKIVPIPLEELDPFVRWGQRIKNCRCPDNKNPKKDTTEFTTMGWSKPWMMKLVAKENPFHTTHISWIDMGISHAVPISSIQKEDVYRDTGNKVHLHVRRCVGDLPVSPNYKNRIWTMVAAGYIVGSIGNVIEFEDDFAKEVEKAIGEGYVVVDEDILATLIYNNPEKYSYSYGNYSSIFSNHHRLCTDAEYLVWMCQDAKERGQYEFYSLLSNEILKAYNDGLLSVSNNLLLDITDEKQMKIITKDPVLLTLHMIVKNEAQRIQKTLDSVKPFIDSWCILDTGSTDGTQDIICKTFENIPGNLYEEPIRTYADTGCIDFSATRNRGLELAGRQSTFLLLLNGDDTLENGADLRRFCEQHRNENDGAYYVWVRGCDRGGYDSSRLMRTSAGWRFRLPTHEVLCGEGSVHTRTPAVIFHEEPPLENRIYRWKQDLVTFNRWLQDNPGDLRALFYLGQTHECLGNNAEAIDCFERRSKLGGWLEELYQCHLRMGGCSKRFGLPWEKVQQHYLDAHSLIPHRLEALYEVAKYWDEKDNHALACLFASEWNSTIPTKDNTLLVDQDIYKWKLANIVSIHSFYLGNKDVGRRAARKALINGPAEQYGNLHRNYAWYAKSAREMFPGFKEIELKLPLEYPWVGVNPSIFLYNDQKICIIRGVNFEPAGDGYRVRDSDGIVRTQNWWTELDDNYNIISAKEIHNLTNMLYSKYPVQGFEDMRLFRWKDRYWATCTVCNAFDRGSSHSTGQRCEIGFLSLTDEHDISSCQLLRGSWSQWHQKNWRPLVRGDRLSWIYSSSPLFIVDYDDNKNEVVSELPPPPPPPLLRGSTRAIQLPDGRFIWMDHEVSFDDRYSGRLYQERFILADKNLTYIIGMSEPFHFHNEPGIEFCAGLALDGDVLVASYGMRDIKAMLGFIPLEVVLNNIIPC